MNKSDNSSTTAPVKAGEFAGVTPEFGRVVDVTRIYGLRRGTLYNLHADGKIRSVLLRIRGKKSGVRLWDMASIGEFIRAEMASAGEESKHTPKRDNEGDSPV